MSAIIFTNEDNKVTLTHFKPEQLSEDRKSKGYKIDNIPDKPETDRGEKAVKYYNPDTEEIYYKIEERPLTQEEKREENEESLDDLWQSHLESEGLI